MNRFTSWSVTLIVCLASLSHAETLQFNINWPSGLSLGEAKLGASKGDSLWNYDLVLDASIPGFKVEDHFRASATAEQCSVEFEKDSLHGPKKTREKTTFDPAKGTATRQTQGGGGKSQLAAPACPHDALTFLFYLRKELAQGRLPAPQEIFYGNKYRIRVDYGGSQRVKVGEEMLDADRINAVVKGPSSDLNLEIYFAKDTARTPLLVKIPLSIGSFSMELVH